MPSQKIPLFDGVMKAVGEPTGLVAVPLFTPPDKALRDGTQAFYEVHMWVVPSLTPDVAPISGYAIASISGAASTVLWQGDDAALDFQAGLPVKVLDGVPVRGDVSIVGLFKSVADATHVYGYYHRVGQGEVVQPARRFIGEAPASGFSAGLSIPFLAGNKKVIHKFEKGRIDEISLAFQKLSVDVAAPTAFLRFEDAAGVLIPGTQPIAIITTTFPDYRRNPASPYNFYQAPFGGSPNLPTLAQLSVESAAAPNAFFAVHGYFTRH
jgi:hypothetical protein